MTTDETHQAELAALHAERVGNRLLAKGDNRGAAVLALFAGALRAGAHLRPAADAQEAAARSIAVVGDVLRERT